MREILFRGKRVDNGEWVEGSLIITTSVKEKTYIVDRCYCYDGYVNKDGYADFDRLNAYEVIPETVGQYTGLTNKNGKKIFEGDCHLGVCDEGTEDETHWVEYVGFCDGSFGFIDHTIGDSSPYPNDCFTPFEYCVLENTDFCGNIHDNPELLKGGATK